MEISNLSLLLVIVTLLVSLSIGVSCASRSSRRRSWVEIIEAQRERQKE